MWRKDAESQCSPAVTCVRNCLRTPETSPVGGMGYGISLTCLPSIQKATRKGSDPGGRAPRSRPAIS